MRSSLTKHRFCVRRKRVQLTLRQISAFRRSQWDENSADRNSTNRLCLGSKPAARAQRVCERNSFRTLKIQPMNSTFSFNLSTYPFIDSMPAEEDIGFDCEDKINGFYASIKFSCQVRRRTWPRNIEIETKICIRFQIYHHCLYGIRSDFICANFTAFDQKTFICHFASEVDCKNSYKYWNRSVLCIINLIGLTRGFFALAETTTYIRRRPRKRPQPRQDWCR